MRHRFEHVLLEPREVDFFWHSGEIVLRGDLDAVVDAVRVVVKAVDHFLELSHVYGVALVPAEGFVPVLFVDDAWAEARILALEMLGQLILSWIYKCQLYSLLIIDNYFLYDNISDNVRLNKFLKI